MFIGPFSERPYQDERLMNRRLGDLMVSNSEYDPGIGHKLYNRYIDEKIYAEQMGFDGVVLNEHHSTFFCMGNVMNIEAAILARVTERVKAGELASGELDRARRNSLIFSGLIMLVSFAVVALGVVLADHEYSYVLR